MPIIKKKEREYSLEKTKIQMKHNKNWMNPISILNLIQQMTMLMLLKPCL